MDDDDGMNDDGICRGSYWWWVDGGSLQGYFKTLHCIVQYPYILDALVLFGIMVV